jgi:putative SOS response-associated peptidase YedK
MGVNSSQMCNLYSMTKGQTAILKVVRATLDKTGNLPTLPGIYPDYPAPIVRHVDGERALVMARWGMPSSRKAIFDAATKRADKLRAKGKNVDFDQLLRDEPDSGTTNVRNTNSAHWKPWLTPEHRCLVPFTAFSEPGRDEAGKYQPIWFRLAGDDPEPLAFFAGIHLPGWEGVRKIKTGRETADLFAFLTTEPNAEVGAVHPKAMPVILTRPEEWECWLNASWSDAVKLQRALPDGSLCLLG